MVPDCRSEPAREKCLGDQKDLIMKKGRYSALRKGRTSLSGQYYHLIFSVKQRRPIFTDFIRARYLVHLMHRVDMQARAITLSYVVMPDHVHWLIKLNADSVSAVVQRLNLFIPNLRVRIFGIKAFMITGFVRMSL